jgi:transcription initiation factor TFIIA large subunit
LAVVVQSGNREIFEPAIYRAVIDEVIASIKPEFDEYGVGEEVLAELQHVSIPPFILVHVIGYDFGDPNASCRNGKVK